MTTARPLYRPDEADAAEEPGSGRQAAGPGGAGGPGAGGSGGRGTSVAARRPETPAEMTSLVPRRAGGRGRPGEGDPPGEDDSGWQPSRSVRKPGGRSVPADRRRTPNPVTDTNNLQPVASPGGERSAGDSRSGERARTETGERRRRAGERAARVSGTGPGGRRASSRSGDGAAAGSAAHTGPARRPARATTSSGLLEPADGEPPRGGQENDLAPQDQLAWLRQGWIGPLAVALVLVLLGVGGYVVLRGGGGGGGGTATAVTASSDPAQGPATTNPDALLGKAMIDGSWQCRLVTGTNPLKLSANVVGVLVVARTLGSYTWQGTAGQYTITPVSGNDGGNVIGEVRFTTGPLKDLTAVHIAKPGAGIGGKAQGTLDLKESGAAAPHRFCGVN